MSETLPSPTRRSPQTGDIGDSSSCPRSKSSKTGTSAQTFPGRASSLAAGCFPRALGSFPKDLPDAPARIPVPGRNGRTDGPNPSTFTQIPPHLPLSFSISPRASKKPTPLLPQPTEGARGGVGGGGVGVGRTPRGAGTQRPGAAPGRADARARGCGRLLLRRRAGDAAAGPAPGAPRSAAPPRRAASGHPRWAKPRGWGRRGRGEGGGKVGGHGWCRPPGVPLPMERRAGDGAEGTGGD